MSETATTEGIHITRTFDAPRELVFRAWTEPAQFAAWFGTTSMNVPVESVTMDLRPGGAWTALMVPGEGQEIPWRGVYREVVEPERIVFTLSDRDLPADDPGEIVTVTFDDLGDGRTEMTFTQVGGHLPPEGYAQAREGWLAFFDSLAETVTG
jgi:uncharacterized protein YndB with AHSA1/START domain